MSELLVALTALASEAESLLRGATLERGRVPEPAVIGWRSLPRAKRALVGFTGLGALAASRALEALGASAAHRPARLVYGGVAGALDPALAAGDLVLVERAVVEKTGDTLATDAMLTDRLARALETGGVSFRRGSVLEVEAIRGEPETKRELAARFPGTSVVAMEDAAVIRVATALGAPVAILRVVIDRTDDRLPDLSPALDAAGRPRVLRLAAHLALRPKAIAGLPGLARSFGRARATLDRALEVALEAS